MKTQKHKIAPIILALLKEIPIGKAIVFIETEKLKANSIHRFLKRRHKRRQLQEFKCVSRKMNDQITAIFIIRKLNINFSFSYIM